MLLLLPSAATVLALGLVLVADIIRCHRACVDFQEMEKFKNMKKIYHYLIAAVAVTVLGLTLEACRRHSSSIATGAEKTEVTVGYENEVCINKVNIDKHEFYLVYATCDGRPGHTVRSCGGNHCFLRHSLDCLCRKIEPSVSVDVVDESDEAESSDPFDF